MAAVLQQSPELALFLALALGHLIGKIRIGGTTLGATVSTLLVAVLISQAGPISLDPVLKSIFFALFIFTIGYRSGPGFFSSFSKTAGPQLMLAGVVAITGIIASVTVALLLGLDKGATGGLFAGALTHSPAIGATTSVLGRLGLPPSETAALNNSAAAAYAVTYLYGQFGMLLYLRNVLPWMLGVDLKKAAAELDALNSAHAGVETGAFSFGGLGARAYRVSSPSAEGRSVADIETLLGGRSFVARIAREGVTLTAQPETMLTRGDILGVIGPRTVLAERAVSLVGDEVADPFSLGHLLESLDVVVTNRAFHDRSLNEIGRELGPIARGVNVLSIHRMELALPVRPHTRLQVGDVIHLVGEEETVSAAARAIGYADWPSQKSDLVFLGLGIVIGTLMGMVAVRIGGVRVGLGSGGGILAAGLVFGWLRARRPTFGKLPPAAQWVFSEFGLSAFIATVGLGAGSGAVRAIADHGLALAAGGAVVTTLPLLVGTLFGAGVLKMNPVLLCGALTGAQTNASCLNALTEASGSDLPALAFTFPYAINALVHTVAASIIVALI